MKFKSTRGQIHGLTFEQAMFMGYATDGGLLMPDEIPKVDQETLRRWSELSYANLCCEILSLYVSDSEIPKDDLKEIVQKAFSSSRGFHNKRVCDLVKITENLQVLELFHGKTKSFKDIPLAVVGQLLEYFLAKKEKHITLLVGTSGDTGSSAIESIRGSALIDIVVLFPKGYCNKIQELQMITVLDDNVHVFAVDGSSDDLDVPLKTCLVDESFVTKYNLGSINSVNMGRVLSQITYFFYAYFKVCKTIGKTVKFVVPTGAMGSVTAGCLANKMGLPIKLECAVNENNIVHRTIASGDFSLAENVLSTWSTAMDIQVPYNMERIWLLVSDMDYKLVASLMEEFEHNHFIKNFPVSLSQKITELFSSDWVTCKDTLATMRSVWDTHNYLLCPHTAVGVTVALSGKATDYETPTICVATASPVKFLEAVKAAGIEFTPPPEIVALTTMPTKQQEMKKGEDWVQMLRAKIEAIG